MNVKKVMVIGPMGSGKSWFLNRVFERKEFPEADLNQPCTLKMDSKSKRIEDHVNGLKYELELLDTPGFRNTNGKKMVEVLDKIKLDELNHLVLVCCLPLNKGNLKKYLNKISKQLIPHLRGSPDSFTLVINKIPAGTRDEKVIKFVRDVGKALKCDVDKFISIQMGESPRNCQFNYVVKNEEGRFESVTQNFLEIVGRSQRIQLVKDKASNKSKPLQRRSTRKKTPKSAVLIELREAERAQPAGQRSVIAIGPRGTGKSWLLNKIFERKQFAEAASIQACTTRLDRAAKNIHDMVNGLEYRLELIDSPALSSEAFDDLDSRFNQVVLVLRMGQPIDKDLERMLKLIGSSLNQLPSKSGVSFTLAINNITSSVSSQELVDFFEQIRTLLGPIDECICVRTDENIRDAVFRYLTLGEDGYVFQDRNFLAVVGTSQALRFTFKNLNKKTTEKDSSPDKESKKPEVMNVEESEPAKKCWPFSC